MSRDKQTEIEKTMRQAHFRLYKVWDNMKSRCYNPKHKSYSVYGARGITICDEWKSDFNSFAKWALANGYDENAPKGQCTIDRIDNNKSYSPENCRWVTIGKNLNNKGSCLLYTHNGKTQSLADWARELDMDYNALLSRMHRNGFNFEQAIMPRKNGSRHLDYDKIRLEVAEEIFGEIERMINRMHNLALFGFSIDTARELAELKKKYIGKDTNVRTNTEEGK